jgi:hypothetical protein
MAETGAPMNDDVRLDWSSIEVHDGKLAVALVGQQPKGWADAFERTARLLNPGTWKKVKLKRGEVRIKPVTPGEEERVKHFLESLVLEANSAIASKNATADEDEAGGAHEPQMHKRSEDQQVTERLRSLAAAEDEPPA